MYKMHFNTIRGGGPKVNNICLRQQVMIEGITFNSQLKVCEIQFLVSCVLIGGWTIFWLETIQIYINIEKEYKKKDEKSSNQRQLNYMKKHKKQTNTH